MFPPVLAFPKRAAAGIQIVIVEIEVGRDIILSVLNLKTPILHLFVVPFVVDQTPGVVGKSFVLLHPAQTA